MASGCLRSSTSAHSTVVAEVSVPAHIMSCIYPRKELPIKTIQHYLITVKRVCMQLEIKLKSTRTRSSWMDDWFPPCAENCLTLTSKNRLKTSSNKEFSNWEHSSTQGGVVPKLFEPQRVAAENLEHGLGSNLQLE
jgi:hypothetical protein